MSRYPAEVMRQGIMVTTSSVVRMAYSRQWLVDTLRLLGYTQAADDALRELPDDISLEQLEAFGDRHGINRGDLVNRMGGSP